MSNLCPKCKFDRSQLKEMLAEKPEMVTIECGYTSVVKPLETENHANARMIIANCPDCREYLKGVH